MWSDPYDNGGSQIKEFELKISSSDQDLTKIVTNLHTYEFTQSEGLIAGTAYTVKVRARNFYTSYFDLH